MRLRAAAFLFLDSFGATPLVTQADLLPFQFEGTRLRLMSTQQGIWKPQQLSAALSFTTVFRSDPASRPYADEVGVDGFLRYKWQGFDANHYLNRALRFAMELDLPLIWFKGIARGVYAPLYPVYLAAEEPDRHQFVVALDPETLRLRNDTMASDPTLVRSYAERVVQVRLHQRVFRERVLMAYDNQCALCRLRHRELLDAAHVIGDAQGGEPHVTNGISMCKIHHGAYDANIFGISPDYQVSVRVDVMQESDGPTLRYALQGIDATRLQLPRSQRSRPDPQLLERRWSDFLAVS